MDDEGKRILIIEDEAMVAMLLEDMITDLGHTTSGVATSLAEAEALLARGPAPDAAILDVNLSGVMSYPVADLLSERGIPFLFSTGYGRQEPMGRYRSPVLQKPFSLSDLRRTLDDVLAGGGDCAARQARRPPRS